MNTRRQTMYVRPRGESWAVSVKPAGGGLAFESEASAIRHARRRAEEVVVLDAEGTVRGDHLPDGDLDRLVAEHYAALGPARKDADCHWEICERWAYGRRIGFSVRHEGEAYEEVGYREEGAEPSREAAAAVLVAHLREAIAKARNDRCAGSQNR